MVFGKVPKEPENKIAFSVELRILPRIKLDLEEIVEEVEIDVEVEENVEVEVLLSSIVF